ncbi:mechanosensitive ion channel family protein [Marinimicrobium sp. ABcell2]|uniref:mechanosensitive ion channel family protein n=1 Tax=Marinimicrobium sp. ABcell2 TaxID=3069751 RepID=UPI0027B096A6|nr:mechanosensitive ion channel domain-containing protein [Marinimicrobium sp. ABcell2]MDQ2076413.1 mechanosensitive ion channel [Marinimicrobium sp. ABcell2]
MTTVLQELEVYFWSLGVISAAIVVGLLVHMVVYQILLRVVKRSTLHDSIPKHLRAPLRLLFPTLAVQLSHPLHALNLQEGAVESLGIVLSTFMIASMAWLLIRATSILRDWVLTQYDVTVSDNLAARKVVTQVDIVRKIMVFIIVVFAVAAALMNFDNFRQVGTGLLASAGVAGLVIGFAAQRTIANVLAGFQIALTQPIRMDDVVIVENEWGRVEEITLTYVVVAIWDMRRLVLPISYFIEQPFQNWTRQSANILGTVFLHMDYTVPIEKIRQFLHEALQESEFWDGQVWRLHVTDSGQRTVELRALMSAESSGNAWELRCEIREKLITYIQQHYPHALPKVRTESFEKGSAGVVEDTV